ncbi:hypothetical protein IFM89_001097 [Coptis chinensis]|uniref:Uncharacterized protein n=1 Tax=Coptis chinensis TaxID=261450 RepID=A0A835HIE6_9MAGN|nr:hypothetical protein IFM89_001097 [Coptis chinensis]
MIQTHIVKLRRQLSLLDAQPQQSNPISAIAQRERERERVVQWKVMVTEKGRGFSLSSSTPLEAAQWCENKAADLALGRREFGLVASKRFGDLVVFLKLREIMSRKVVGGRLSAGVCRRYDMAVETMIWSINRGGLLLIVLGAQPGCCSSQDIQSQITTVSLADSHGFYLREFQDNSGGTSSSNVDFDESSLFHQGAPWKQVSPFSTSKNISQGVIETD